MLIHDEGMQTAQDKKKHLPWSPLFSRRIKQDNEIMDQKLLQQTDPEKWAEPL